MSPKRDSFKTFILEQLGNLPGLTCRAMFGGYGLYQKAKFFGIIHKGRLYFKVMMTTVSRYQEACMKPFRPHAKQTFKSLYEVPVDVIEDPEALTSWAKQSIKA